MIYVYHRGLTGRDVSKQSRARIRFQGLLLHGGIMFLMQASEKTEGCLTATESSWRGTAPPPASLASISSLKGLKGHTKVRNGLYFGLNGTYLSTSPGSRSNLQKQSYVKPLPTELHDETRKSCKSPHHTHWPNALPLMDGYTSLQSRSWECQKHQYFVPWRQCLMPCLFIIPSFQWIFRSAH